MSSICTEEVSQISEYAIIVDPKDNVAVVKKETLPGQDILLPNGGLIRVRESVPPGHRFSTRDIPTGDLVLQYGQPIGTSLGIDEGERISPGCYRQGWNNTDRGCGFFERMSSDLDLSAGGVVDGTETIEEVGARVFEHVGQVASGIVLAKAEEHMHREFQFWAEQTVSL